MTIRVLTVDDHPVVRAGIAAMIANEPDMHVVGEAADGAAALELYAAHHPDVVLMELRMPRMDGVSAIRAIRAADPDARIVALTTYEGDAETIPATERRDETGLQLTSGSSLDPWPAVLYSTPECRTRASPSVNIWERSRTAAVRRPRGGGLRCNTSC